MMVRTLASPKKNRFQRDKRRYVTIHVTTDGENGNKKARTELPG